jgi:GDP-L-fucose synthase
MTSGSQLDPSFWKGRTVAVTGGSGFLGSAIVSLLDKVGAETRVVRSSDYDLRDPVAARRALQGVQIAVNLAARVGGIGYNRRNPAPLLRDNLLIAVNVFDAARDLELEKLVTAGSVCAYPKFTPTPFSEKEIWNGYPEESNAPYGVAKRVSQELADTYRRQYGLNAVVPVLANLYGPRDNFDLEDSHVVPALIRKFNEAAEKSSPTVEIWGTGSASREFLYVDDGAQALLLAAERLEISDPVNIGTGRETKIKELAEMIRDLTGFEGEIDWDSSKPDGQPERSLDVSKASELLGFEAKTSLEEGLQNTIEWFRTHAPAQN